MVKKKSEAIIKSKCMKTYFAELPRNVLIKELENTEKALTNQCTSEELKKLYKIRYKNLVGALIEKINRCNLEQT